MYKSINLLILTEYLELMNAEHVTLWLNINVYFYISYVNWEAKSGRHVLW